MAFNEIILLGNITKDIELKQTQSGIAVASFTIAVNRKFKDASGNAITDFINCVAWRKTAETIATHFKKGRPILVRGELQTRSYTDKNGDKRSVWEVAVDEFSFVAGKEESAPAYVPDAYTEEPKFEALDAEGDLPF